MEIQLNGLVIEPEVEDTDQIAGTTEVSVDVWHRTHENLVALSIIFEGSCQSHVNIVAEKGRIYVEMYPHGDRGNPRRIELNTYYFQGEEPGPSTTDPPPGKDNHVGEQQGNPRISESDCSEGKR